MKAFSWNAVLDVVDAVLERPPEERFQYLNQACLEPEIRRRVESLILSYGQAGEFLEEPALAGQQNPMGEEENAESWTGRHIGSYQIVEMIGQGGMGAVYRAVRDDDQYQKQVAIKLVRGGFDSSFAFARFRSERQILASLEHANIARLLDGGATADGSPYFVMEFAAGQPDRSVLRCEEAAYRGTASTLSLRLRRGPICAPESGDPSRFETGKHSGHL